MREHSSSSSHSKSRSRRYYDRKRSRSRSRSRDRSYRRRSHSPKDRNLNNKLMGEKLKKAIQKQLVEAKTEINNSNKESVETITPKPEPLSFDEQLKRANQIQDISLSNFQSKSFTSDRTLNNQLKINALADIPLPSSLNWRENPELVLHPNLFEPHDVKMERWIRKLSALRRKMKKSEKHFDSSEELA